MNPVLGALAMICMMVRFIAYDEDGRLTWVPIVLAAVFLGLAIIF